MFRQNFGCNNLIRTSSDGTNGGTRWSLTESRHSIASTKNAHRRSNRQSNYRSPPANQTRTSKRVVQHQDSDLSLSHGHQQRPEIK
jgi:hypothetical protein